MTSGTYKPGWSCCIFHFQNIIINYARRPPEGELWVDWIKKKNYPKPSSLSDQVISGLESVPELAQKARANYQEKLLRDNINAAVAFGTYILGLTSIVNIFPVFSLVEKCRGLAFIGREDHSVAPPWLLCHKEPYLWHKRAGASTSSELNSTSRWRTLYFTTRVDFLSWYFYTGLCSDSWAASGASYILSLQHRRLPDIRLRLLLRTVYWVEERLGRLYYWVTLGSERWNSTGTFL